MDKEKKTKITDRVFWSIFGVSVVGLAVIGVLTSRAAGNIGARPLNFWESIIPASFCAGGILAGFVRFGQKILGHIKNKKEVLTNVNKDIKDKQATNEKNETLKPEVLETKKPDVAEVKGQEKHDVKNDPAIVTLDKNQMEKKDLYKDYVLCIGKKEGNLFLINLDCEDLKGELKRELGGRLSQLGACEVYLDGKIDQDRTNELNANVHKSVDFYKSVLALKSEKAESKNTSTEDPKDDVHTA